MWQRVLFRIFLLVLCFVAVVFAIANRRLVEITFDPLPMLLQVPLYAALFVAGLGGVICGWVLCWFGQRSWRHQARRLRRQLAKLTPPLDPISGSGENQVEQEGTQR